MSARSVAVFDIDGVVADVRHRLKHISGRQKDWNGFFAAAGHDAALADGIALLAELSESHDIVWLTGRPERLRAITTRWLAKHGLPTEPLLMRADGDFQPARVTKLRLLTELLRERDVAVVIDDDPDVVAALKEVGLPVRLADWVPHEKTLHDAQERSGRT